MCNAWLSCTTAFSTGYASRCLSSYKSLGQDMPRGAQCSEFTWLLLFSKDSAQYIILVKFFPPPFGDDVWALFCAMPSNKLGTLLSGAVKSAQRIPPCPV